MPEEINRVLTDHLSDLLFYPTDVAVANLAKEGITKNVYQVGDVMYDAFLENMQTAKSKSTILGDLDITRDSYILVTVHRAENADNPNSLGNIVSSLFQLDHEVVWPLHPRTRQALEKNDLLGELERAKHIKVIDPVGYLDMLVLEYHSAMVMTDSGGVQKEAFFFCKPRITLREETE